MKGHDSSDMERLLAEARLLAEKPELGAFASDAEMLDEIRRFADNPVFLATLMFKLAKEREKTNRLLEQIFDKFDKIMLSVKSENPSLPTREGKIELLPGQDQKIIEAVHRNGQVEARQIKEELGYRGLNAASQRLNRLFREGYLSKVQSGKKVLFLARL
ncbi:MAG: hypothetical protein HY394_04755 [Candidatus Diapherotrites archaeon]|nr:hypothetical protein [Candidatus Diapherotrites archaeon]